MSLETTVAQIAKQAATACGAVYHKHSIDLAKKTLTIEIKNKDRPISIAACEQVTKQTQIQLAVERLCFRVSVSSPDNLELDDPEAFIGQRIMLQLNNNKKIFGKLLKYTKDNVDLEPKPGKRATFSSKDIAQLQIAPGRPL